ncbi:sugar ABC transporter permease, partial [Enterococcus durans]|nr:sugar ABC transporter permease [Enterococcus durans]
MKNKNGESLVSRIFTLRNMAVVFLVVYFAIFLAYPIFKAFAGSLHNWNPLIGTYDWVGLDNFKQILTDKLFWTSMGNTAVFAGVSTLFRIVLGLGLALLLSAKLVKCKDTLR